MNELISYFNKIVKAVNAPGPRRIAATTALALQRERIFTKGQASDNSQIGTYSTNPISIAKSKQARNTGQTRFPGGYSEYKTKIGKNQGFVNLRNTDQMMNDYGVIVNGDAVALGFQNQVNGQKAGWMDEKYDKEIFHLSDKEVETSINVLVDEQMKAV